MTNPRSAANSTAETPAVAAPDAPVAAAKSPRNGPRRATAPAGAPAKTSVGAPALLVIDADGMIVPTPAPISSTTTAPAPGAASPTLPAPDATDAEPTGVASVDADSPQDVAAETAPVTTDETSGDVSADAETDAEADAPATVHVAEAAPAAELVAEPAFPLSRRERRLAEQNGSPGAAVAPPVSVEAAATPSAAVADVSSDAAAPSDRKQTPDRPGKRRNKYFSFARGLFFLLVISTLVVGLGTVLADRDELAVGPSQTEANRQAAWEKTTLILAQTTQLGSSASGAKVQELLTATAKELAVQVAALSDGLPANTATTTTTAPAPTTLTQLGAALHANGEELLSNAVNAEHAMGRVFAAVGTSQLLRSRNLSTVVGTAQQPTTFLPARIDFPAPAGPACKSTLEPRPGLTIDAALRAAALGEQKAVYAYQVATTRFAEPEFSASEQLLARHQQKLQVLNDELALRCLPLATPVAGFALAATFTTAPVKALAGLESELGAIYGDLAALSTAQDDSAATPASATTATTVPSQEPSNASMLREISVTWLLDSAQAQSTWGGTIGALPGLAEASPPTTTAAP
ncbi:DUF4439 domain-containing protein [Arthrobacter sp. TMN-49]